MTRIEQLLRERIGLDSSSIGASSVHRAVRLRMKALGIASPDEYENVVGRNPSEWTELIEGIVVRETWFFRDGEPFEALVRLAREHSAAAPGTGPLRVLSVPCASGEEPYSLAMALLDAGIGRHEFQIEAADISPRALEQARLAIYGRNSFRGKDLSFRDRCFKHVKEGWALHPRVCAAVRFFEGNILRPEFLSGNRPYDVIFCRNLLIYLDAAARAKALNTVARLLSPDGIVVVGAAEQPLAFQNGFESANIPMAFACRVVRPASQLHSARLLNLTTTTATAALTADAIARFNAFASQRSGPRVNSPAPRSLPDLVRARRLADEGKIREAEFICQDYLRQDAASAQAWYLLGVVRDATADPLAFECYRKALYLDPNHYETLVKMALIFERGGDLSRARTFRRRAARAQSNSAQARL